MLVFFKRGIDKLLIMYYNADIYMYMEENKYGYSRK